MTIKNKIYFTCPWEDAESLLFKYKKNTPKLSGIWKNIEATSNYEETEYLIVLDNINNDILKRGQENFLNKFSNLDKVIHFQRENESIIENIDNWYMNNIFPKLKNYISPQNGFYFNFAPPIFIDKTYDELKQMTFPEKTKNISTITSYKHNPNINDGYNKRITFIKKYSNKYKIDIFGKDWNKSLLGDNYKGELEGYHNNSIKKNLSTNKSDGLLKYNYSIALENYPNDKIISEKFTDCILCWCMPIYWGNNESIKNCYPSNSYHLINIENNNIFEEIEKIISNIPNEKNIKALEKARNLILDKLNIWEYIYQIINNFESLIYNYKYTKFISLGSNCFSAGLLKTYKLRTESYMFDWSISSVNNVIDILKNYNKYNCNKLIQNNNLINFYHHNNLEQRKRAIDRFFNIINKDNINKIFIIIEENNNNDNCIKNLIQCLVNKINNFIKLIHIQYKKNNEHKIETVLISNNYDKFILYTPFSCPYSLKNEDCLNKYKIFENIIKKYKYDIDINDIFNKQNILEQINETNRLLDNYDYIYN